MPLVMCDNCGKMVSRSDRKYATAKNHFCSRDCYYRFKRKYPVKVHYTHTYKRLITLYKIKSGLKESKKIKGRFDY